MLSDWSKILYSPYLMYTDGLNGWDEKYFEIENSETPYCWYILKNVFVIHVHYISALIISRARIEIVVCVRLWLIILVYYYHTST